jgi:phytol kinase
MISPWLGMALVVGSLGLLMGVLRLWQRLGTPHPELVRKCLHMGMGLLTLSFPWLFDVAWPIIVLGVTSAVGMLALRLIKGLRTGVGSVVAGVPRATFGEVYFPIAVGILFLLFRFEPIEDESARYLLYCIPVLLLTLADAMAALIGVRYGSAHYSTSEGHKTVEGSLAFFLVGFFCTHVPLLLYSEKTGRTECLLIGLLLAWLAMMFEAISWGGLDNLALPLVSYLLLRAYLDLSIYHLLLRIAVTAGLTGFALLYAHRSTLVGSAVIGVILAGYICWAVGGWPWLVPPLTLFLTYTLLSPRTPDNSRHIHNIHAVVCVCSTGLLWLFLFRILDQQGFLYLFTLSFAAHLAIIGVARLGYDYPAMKPVPLLLLCGFQGWLFLFVPYAIMQWNDSRVVVEIVMALPATALAAAGFYLTQPEVRNCPADTLRWLRQAAHATAASAVGLVPLYLL